MRITRKQLRQLIRESMDELGRITEDIRSAAAQPVPAGLMAQALRDFPGKTKADLTYSLTEDGTGYTGFDRTWRKEEAWGGIYNVWLWSLRLDGKVYTYEDANADQGSGISESNNWRLLSSGIPLEDCLKYKTRHC